MLRQPNCVPEPNHLNMVNPEVSPFLSLEDCQLPDWMKRELINGIPGIFFYQILLAQEILHGASKTIAEISGDLMKKIFENNAAMDETIKSAMEHVDKNLLAVANYMAGVAARPDILGS